MTQLLIAADPADDRGAPNRKGDLGLNQLGESRFGLHDDNRNLRLHRSPTTGPSTPNQNTTRHCCFVVRSGAAESPN
jgi:hypothetical protein